MRGEKVDARANEKQFINVSWPNQNGSRRNAAASLGMGKFLSVNNRINFEKLC